MAKKRAPRKTSKKKPKRFSRWNPLGWPPVRWVLAWTVRLSILVSVTVILVIAAHSVMTPPKTHYMRQEAKRLGEIDYVWVPYADIAPVMARSVVAAEDANFCNHWGFDMAAIRNAIEEGGTRGASTISQQTVKNMYLWHGRSWARKALEALITPLLEVLWSKQRIVEVYMNIAEFDEGVFGVEAASHHYFGVGPSDLSAQQAAQLAAVLPNPKNRSASRPTANLRKRANSIRDGAATIRRDGRADCFED
ncbi:MAG: monofunctional biosynthetic peptidoglycan transglycosylase [Pseudomonadota bacterium]